MHGKFVHILKIKQRRLTVENIEILDNLVTRPHCI
jgi:hypothetical protein